MTFGDIRKPLQLPFSGYNSIAFVLFTSSLFFRPCQFIFWVCAIWFYFRLNLKFAFFLFLIGPLSIIFIIFCVDWNVFYDLNPVKLKIFIIIIIHNNISIIVNHSNLLHRIVWIGPKNLIELTTVSRSFVFVLFLFNFRSRFKFDFDFRNSRHFFFFLFSFFSSFSTYFGLLARLRHISNYGYYQTHHNHL